MIGSGGKYDDLCEAMLRATNAKAVMLVVVEGTLGTGFSLSVVQNAETKLILARFPHALETVAEQITKDAITYGNENL